MFSKRKHDNHFSEEIWSHARDHYQISINGLSQDNWDQIIDGAWQITQAKMSGCATSSRLLGTQLPEIDERELLFEANNGENVEDDKDMDWDNILVETCTFFLILL